MDKFGQFLKLTRQPDSVLTFDASKNWSDQLDEI